eukprot:1977804-Prymnesium_polylepis.1
MPAVSRFRPTYKCVENRGEKWRLGAAAARAELRVAQRSIYGLRTRPRTSDTLLLMRHDVSCGTSVD